MANTYTQIHIHVVFAVSHRRCLISTNWKDDLFKYITGIFQNHGHKMIVINAVSDHVHMLIGLRPKQALSELIKYVKQDSTKWINSKGLTPQKFQWQQGYGAFSHSNSELPRVIEYIRNQEKHHGTKSFHDEYILLLKKFGLSFDQKFLFKPMK